MLQPSARFTRSGWYLYPGPLVSGGEPIHTVALDDITEYDYPLVGDAVLAVAGTRCVHPPEPRWDDWRARWESGGSSIEVDMFPDSEHMVSPRSGRYIWSGGWLYCDCTVGDLAGFLRAVRERCPGVWLCDGGD